MLSVQTFNQCKAIRIIVYIIKQLKLFTYHLYINDCKVIKFKAMTFLKV